MCQWPFKSRKLNSTCSFVNSFTVHVVGVYVGAHLNVFSVLSDPWKLRNDPQQSNLPFSGERWDEMEKTSPRDTSVYTAGFLATTWSPEHPLQQQQQHAAASKQTGTLLYEEIHNTNKLYCSFPWMFVLWLVHLMFILTQESLHKNILPHNRLLPLVTGDEAN